MKSTFRNSGCWAWATKSYHNLAQSALDGGSQGTMRPISRHEPAKSLEENGQCLSACGASRAGGASGTVPFPSPEHSQEIQSEGRSAGLSCGTVGQLCPGEIIPRLSLSCLLSPSACLLFLFCTYTELLLVIIEAICLFVLLACLFFSWFSWFKPNSNQDEK